MIYYFLLLNKHKNLSLKRKVDYKKNLLIIVLLIIFSIMFFLLFLAVFSKEDIEAFSIFLLPIIVIIDLSLRFFLKKNTSAVIISYLTLPIPCKTLISYIIFSDLLRFWIWGCGLIYSIILYYCNVITFLTVITLLLFVLLNNYLIVLIKALIEEYAILTYPIWLGFIFVLLLITEFLNPVICISIFIFLIISIVTVLFLILKENLRNELNRIAL